VLGGIQQLQTSSRWHFPSNEEHQAESRVRLDSVMHTRNGNTEYASNAPNIQMKKSPSVCMQVFACGCKERRPSSSIIKVRSPKLNAAEECGSSMKSTLTLMTKAPAGMIRKCRGVSRQDFD
jgi:hypothetical protein